MSGCSSCNKGSYSTWSGYNSGGGFGCTRTCDILKDAVQEQNCCQNSETAIYVYNVSELEVAANGSLTFDHVGSFSNITPPTNIAPHQIHIRYGGKYKFEYYVIGRNPFQTIGTDPALPLCFEITGNGQSILGTQYTSQGVFNTIEGGVDYTINAFGIIDIPANTIIEVKNLTRNNATPPVQQPVNIALYSVTEELGSPLAVNASLRLTKMC